MNKIDTRPFEIATGKLEPRKLGPLPKLKWIAVDKLVIDPTYQRDILKTGLKNIVRIAHEFDWIKFATVIVAPSGANKFAIVDGQHRTTAAALRGVKEVPCQIIEAKAAQQAAAFAAINANITAMSPMQLHAAKLAAGDTTALRLKKCCADAGVTILRYPVQTKNQKVGETMAVGMLYQMLNKFGETVLVSALNCITKTRNGNAGLIRGQLITALCVNLEAEPPWQQSPKLLAVMGKLDMADAIQRASREATAGGGSNSQTAVLVEIIGAFLDQHLTVKVA